MITRAARNVLARLGTLAERRHSRHVVIEPSDYVLRNFGDMAMLEATVTRVADLMPLATIHVLTDSPAELPRYRPNVVPLAGTGRQRWLDGHHGHPEALHFAQMVTTASLLVVAGMGGLTDAFPTYANSLLSTIELAAGNGVPVVLFGQGMGPLGEPVLRERTASVLPLADMIALREGKAGIPLLLALGVPRDRLIVTGDDVIEMAYRIRGGAAREGIGINLRAASYSGVSDLLIEQVRTGVQAAASRHRAPLVAIPISRVPGEADADTIDRLVAGCDVPVMDARGIDSARAMIRRVQHCRVVVTGSYHAGVFALASGIPVVGLARSSYYEDKFRGLADQFGAGCSTLVLNEDCSARIEAAIAEAWSTADAVRADLLEAAGDQIALGRAAYRRLPRLAARSQPRRSSQ